MTYKTDIAALREECAQWVKGNFGDLIDTRTAMNGGGNDYMSWDMAALWLAWNHLSDKLEAERQRADAMQSERDEFRRRLKLERSILEDADKELAALKGERVPVANPVLAYADSYRTMARQGSDSVPIWGVINDLERNIAPLFTAQQKPVVLPGISELIDACDSTPAVRDVHVWDLAISEVKRLNPGLFSDKSAAGGILKDGE